MVNIHTVFLYLQDVSSSNSEKSMFLLKTEEQQSNNDNSFVGSTSLSLTVPGHKEAGLTMKPKAISILFQAPKPPYKSTYISINPYNGISLPL